MDFSIIIPVRNMQDRIAACLRSITRCPRDGMDMECIVVDDGSEDETAARVKRYMERDGRIRLVTKENRGMSDARNRGIEEAGGRYLMFLDADSGLCEDAWEQIAAAVEEEYADFVAFSHVTLCRNGKFKAQMLPIPDVISTDEREARKLMYADSAFQACQGKLFRSDIVKLNHITFRTDLPFGGEFLFVAEYFGSCESYLMTKAMIFYRRQNGGIPQDRSMDDRLGQAGTQYGAAEEAVERCGDAELEKCMQVYYLGVLADIFGAYAGECHYGRAALREIYANALGNAFVGKILDAVDERAIRSVRRAYEYRLLKRGNVKKIQRYFSLRSFFTGVSDGSGSVGF